MLDNNPERSVLKNKFIIFSVILFLVILVAGSLAFMLSMQQIIRVNKGNEMAQMLETELIRLESSLNSEIAVVLKMATSPIIRKHIADPEDPDLKEIAFEEMDSYRNAFSGNLIFWMSDTDKIFYFDNTEPYVVDVYDPINYWYNMTLYETEVYNFNINYNPDIDQIRLWINAPVFNDKGVPVGMVGTGIDLSLFVDTLYRNINERTNLYFFLADGTIYGARDIGLIIEGANINDVLYDIGIDISDEINFLGITEKRIFEVSNRIITIGYVPILGLYYIATLTYSIADFDIAMTGLFFVMILLILLIIIIVNIFAAQYLKHLRNAMISLEIASKAKSEFLATMSHEIRTPLNAVIGFSEIELLGMLPDDSKESIRQIHQSGEILLGIIGDILDISKIEAGKFEFDSVEYGTASLLSDTLHLNIVKIENKPIDLLLEIEGDFPGRLKGDELRVKQVLNNILSNAIKYTNEGTIVLKAEWEKPKTKDFSDDDVLLRFSVKDTGIGIRNEDMNKLFESYTQLDSGANRKLDGTGLGLAITKTLAEMMGGRIRAESEYGKGSVFTVEFKQKIVGSGSSGPNQIGDEVAGNLKNFRYAIKRNREHIERPRIPNCKILIVDDNTANLRVVRGLLLPYGLSPDTASSGSEAVDKVKALISSGDHTGYDMILMDHMMPVTDGIDTAAIIRNLPGDKPGYLPYQNTPIIALTANALRGMKEYYIDHGFDDYLCKPIDPRLLNDVILKWIPSAKNSISLLTGTGSYEGIECLETDIQRADRINHFRAAFESGREIDSDYLLRFTILLSSLDLYKTDDKIKEKADILIEAGRAVDLPVIKEMLPDFCNLLRKHTSDIFDREASQKSTGTGSSQKRLPDDFISKLKKALLKGDSKTSVMILSELDAEELYPAGRELYYLLYDFLSEGKIDRAIDTLFFWERFEV